MLKIKEDILRTLRGSKHILLAGHVNADGDSLGSILAVAGWFDRENIEYQIVNEGVIPSIYGFLPGLDKFEKPEDVLKKSTVFDTVLVMEASNLKRIGRAAGLISDKATVINIDHHKDNESFGKYNWKDPSAAAAGEMVYDLFQFGQIAIDKDMATNLYTAILTDTGRFHFDNTSPKILRIAADLVEMGADPRVITDNVYFSQPSSKMLLMGMALAGMRFDYEGRICSLAIDHEMLEKTGTDKGDTEGLINNTMAVSGVTVGLLFTELHSGQTKVSFRSRGQIDVGAVAAHFEGGGHAQASGATISLPLDKARKQVIEYIKENLNGSV